MKGAILTRRGKSYIRNADSHDIYVRRACLRAFYQKVGLTIERKKIRLEKELELR